MKTNWRSLQGTAKEDRGRRETLKYLRRRDPKRLILVGPVSSEIRCGFSLDATEQLLDGMVGDGLLRIATQAELKALGSHHGYYLTEKGIEAASG